MIDPYMIALGLIGDRELTDEVLTEIMAMLTAMPQTKSADLPAVRKRLETTIGVAMSIGTALTDEETTPWLEDIKAATQWNYWDSYITQLKSDGFAPAVLRTLNEDTDNILTRCGNPSDPNGWNVKGLVMGDVQSGKTASYCGLISKAADTGYRVIVLLTGTIEELRSQSQERLDEGFVGKDSRRLLKGESGAVKIGAGRFRQQIPNVLTSIDSDFLTSNRSALRGIPLENINEPVLLVMKKNKTALENLLSFLDTPNPTGAKKLHLPLLIVDDEADNASVNAKKDDDPATINRLIRSLIGNFYRATYVAYTATPFANVFINPDLQDLFPKNFVYSLDTPSNYIGAGSIFSEPGDQDHQLVEITDAAAAFPDNHRKTLEINDLPPSLQDAIGIFLLACAVRDLRGEVLKHRSMLINATRFSDVQGQLAAVVKNSLYLLIEDIKQYLADDLWVKHASLNRLHELYLEHYRDCGVKWDAVRAKLYDSVASVKVLTINQKTDKSERLNYRAYKTSEKGRRVIAIGGLSLSRGLTLEGLCISYFYRNSKAYDTLLQMGRWFGYRTGYDDLCRIWMTSQAQGWFSYIANVVAELRDDIKGMQANNSPPKDFGMRVRSHPSVLLITAANKMRNSEEVTIDLSFSRSLTETPFLPKTAVANNNNAKAVSSFLKSLGAAQRAGGSRHVWRGVTAKAVADFLQQLEIPAVNPPFLDNARSGGKPIIKFIRDNTVLKNWDICIVGGEGDTAGEIEFVDEDGTSAHVKKRKRQFQKPSSRSVSYLMVNKQRVGDISDEKVLLTDEQIKRAEDEWNEEDKTRKGKKVPGRAYVRVREYPLLTIHPIEPTDPNPNKDSKATERILTTDSIEPKLLIGLSLSIPGFKESSANSVTYSLNKVYLRSLGLLDAEDEGEDED